MSSSTTTQLADSIVTALNGKFNLGATRVRLPQIKKSDLSTLSVYVVPRGRTTEILSRDENHKTHKIEIGVMRLVTDINSTANDSIDKQVEDITDYLLGSDIGEYTCLEAISVLADESIFAKEHLAENVYTSVIITSWE